METEHMAYLKRRLRKRDWDWSKKKRSWMYKLL